MEALDLEVFTPGGPPLRLVVAIAVTLPRTHAAETCGIVRVAEADLAWISGVRRRRPLLSTEC